MNIAIPVLEFLHFLIRDLAYYVEIGPYPFFLYLFIMPLWQSQREGLYTIIFFNWNIFASAYTKFESM